MKKQTFTHYLAEDNFEDLFIELGWNDFGGDKLLYPAEVDGKTFDFYVVAQQSGFMVLKCAVDWLPTTALYKKLDTQIRKSAHEYICIYYVPGKMKQMWIVPVDKVDKRDLVSVKYADEDHAEFLYEKVEGFTFPLGEETNILDVKNRVQKAFIVNSEKLTKKFYDEFKKQHKAFESFIDGIPSDDDRRWYASIMLDRLMFCYFIQKKGFLDANKNYLQDKLKQVRAQEGENEFYAFYRNFLCHLFRDGLNTPHHDTNEFLNKFGRIPYLNGGMFDVHSLETKYNDIQIKDDAFEHLFNFFDQWEWHLDTRMSSSGRDINPDVLGYIFERFINDRAQMGAYYTQEDITGYISRNCILPFLFDKMNAKMPQLFKKGGKIWTFLQKSGDRYIYDAVKKGFTADWRNCLPEDIAIGLDTSKPNLLERRKHWNEKTHEEFALPTEIWRETIERFRRCENLLKKIADGEIDNINDFITYNLNIRLFAYEVLEKTDDHNLIRHFYHALQDITILDPTCGSGAFLFAAMNILEPLYEVCIMRMQEFNKENINLFKDELGEISNKYRSNIQYFIFKSIILRNLYGVDIMAEAIEIAKLRLFLKMVAVVDVDMRAENLGLDPLPDIDFNIRCGNTLVGYATEEQLDKSLKYGDMFANQEFRDKIQSKLNLVSKTYNTFKWLQMNQQDDRKAFQEAKRQLAKELESLNEDLNQHLYGKKPDIGYNPWLKNTQPFHWVAEFYEIMHNGGFDIIIGNPPYVVYTDRKSPYHIGKEYHTLSCANLYAFCIERSQYLQNRNGRFGMIVPNSSISADKMLPLQKVIRNNHTSWISNYSWRPSKLFEGADMLLAIIITCSTEESVMYSSIYRKWYNEYRECLFKYINYIDVSKILIDGSIPKIPNKFVFSILDKMSKVSNKQTLTAEFLPSPSKYYLYYFRAVQYWFKILDTTPIFVEDGENKLTGEMKTIYVTSEIKKYDIISFLSSSCFFLNYIIWSSCQVVNSRDFNVYFNFGTLADEEKKKLERLGEKLQKDYQKHSEIKTRNYSKKGREFTMKKQHFFIKNSKPIIDEIDKVLAKHYGFTDEELDFIINYDIKYRMGDELND